MGHGTSVASVISARNYNLRGIDGVSYNAKIVPVNIGKWVLVDPEKDVWKASCRAASMAKGINRVVGDEGIDNLKVINISFLSLRFRMQRTD